MDSEDDLNPDMLTMTNFWKVSRYKTKENAKPQKPILRDSFKHKLCGKTLIDGEGEHRWKSHISADGSFLKHQRTEGSSWLVNYQGIAID